MSAPLYAAAWILGEFAEHCKELPFALELLTRPLVRRPFQLFILPIFQPERYLSWLFVPLEVK